MTQWSIPVVLALLTAACQTSQGENVPVLADDVKHTFIGLDSDRDGFISRTEAQAAPLLARNFEHADADGNGRLDRFEFNAPAWTPRRASR